mmetsp:Transcript_10366/g.20848  ORF Transcript_10366/g.20848 Transcript_10366/m.20848 type:complete len:255 (-) Transcript_10366:169-933(-)
MEDRLEDDGRKERVAVEGDVEEEPASRAADELRPDGPLRQRLPQRELPRRARQGGLLTAAATSRGRDQGHEDDARQGADPQDAAPGDPHEAAAAGGPGVGGAEPVEEGHADQGDQQLAHALHGEDERDAPAAVRARGALRGDGGGERVDAADADAQEEARRAHGGEDARGGAGVQRHGQGRGRGARDAEGQRELQGAAPPQAVPHVAEGQLPRDGPHQAGRARRCDLRPAGVAVAVLVLDLQVRQVDVDEVVCS